MHLVLQVAAEKDVCAVHLNLKPKAHADIPFATNQIHVVAMLKFVLFYQSRNLLDLPLCTLNREKLKIFFSVSTAPVTVRTKKK